MSLCSFTIVIGLPTLVTPPAAWEASHAYVAGDRVVNDTPKRLYICVVPGTSAAAGGPTGTGAGIADGTVTWDYVSPFAVPGIPAIPSLTLTLPPCYLDEF